MKRFFLAYHLNPFCDFWSSTIPPVKFLLKMNSLKIKKSKMFSYHVHNHLRVIINRFQWIVNDTNTTIHHSDRFWPVRRLLKEKMCLNSYETENNLNKDKVGIYLDKVESLYAKYFRFLIKRFPLNLLAIYIACILIKHCLTLIHSL